jgi:uncharacterized membrane protein YhdT
MNTYYPQQYVYYPAAYPQTTYQPQWIELIPTVVVGLMFIVVMFGMVRDLFKGKEVKFPF